MDAQPTARTANNPTHRAQPAPDREDAGYAQGWMDAVRAARAAQSGGLGGLLKPPGYFDGWLDAVTLQPIDPARLELSKGYARGYAAGAKQYERAVSAEGYDAE